jgi:2-polyprenyl-3-methyl-5-hydroxy-6-metoxy-1,4-benzoquinol methylase
VKIVIDQVVHPLHRRMLFGADDVAQFPPHAVCPACRSSREPEPLASLGLPEWRQGLAVVQCPECELVYYRNPPGDDWLRTFYRESWNRGIGENLRGGALRASSRTKPRMAWLLDDLGIEDRKARILDVGCGVGAMLAGLAAAGFTELMGTEASDYRVAASRLRFPGRIFAGGYAGVPDEFRFDVIYSNHVLEHIRVPADAIDWMAAHLSERGILAVTVPNAWEESLLNQILFLPHLHSFSARSLQRLAELRGLRCVLWRGARWYELTAVFTRDPAFRARRPERFIEPEQVIARRSGSQAARFREIWGPPGRRRGVRSIYVEKARPDDRRRGYGIPGIPERASARLLGLAHGALARAGLAGLRSRLPFKTGYLRFHGEDDGDGVPCLSFAGGRGGFQVK